MPTPDGDEAALLRRLRETPELFERLRDASGPELGIQAQLRREFDDDLVRAACALAALRRRATAKFSRAERMWFDGRGLEQATSEAVARHKAQRFAGFVRDWCCGIGGDTIALAVRAEVHAVDSDPANCLRTRWNAEAYGVADDVETTAADVTTLEARDGLLHIDPDRRPGGRGRVVRVEDCRPGLEFLRRLTVTFRGGAIKLSPAGNFAGKFDDAEYELISLDGECKEATVWFGELAVDGRWSATVLPDGATLAGDPLEAYPQVGPLGRYLYDPDPAVVRSALLDVLCERRNLRRLDEAEEYLTADDLVDSPFVRAFEVLAELPNNDKQIRRWFRGSDVGQVEIKCRHIPIDAESVRRKLPLPGRTAAALIFARVAGRARAVIARRLARPTFSPHE